MISIVKEMCIFMIIAQAILFLVPGSAYVKYVRVLVGIMMIMGITGPLFGLFINEEKKLEIQKRAALLEESIRMEGYDFPVWDSSQEIYAAVEQELKARLEECESNYRVVDAEVLDDKVVVTVEEKEDEKQENCEESIPAVRIEPVRLGEMEKKKTQEPSDGAEQLKELYGSHIGVNAEKIEIIFQQEKQ